ncbi:hypothetical protein BMS3Abin05_01360 [bacterium BMS3Abin05]|nr:hypothetical protein BMS3Abin05_01360 [bacterium BMS3Abin05]GBE28229.1 hypothetical protein BMS3Bbin03_02168 [bacterium BMS3Bbin03]HDL78820.1 hypothetical protein [Bacteroidota bacterium]HDZ10621.1 hypothetical protein [Bacteroidota bacterium]
MAKKKKKVQKSIEIKRAKRKSGTKRSGGSPGGPSASIPSAAVEFECFVPAKIFEKGMGSVIFAGKLQNGTVAMSMFLVDTFCLGIKNAFSVVLSPEEYSKEVQKFAEREALEPWSPSCCRKLIEEAEEYAMDLGFRPHKDYRKAKKIFEDIDASSCSEEFEYGNNGKPFFISGPTDSPLRIQQIIHTLTRRLGPDGFNQMIAISPDDLDWQSE